MNCKLLRHTYRLFLLLTALSFADCAVEDDHSSAEKPQLSSTSGRNDITMTYDIAKSKTFSFISSAAWTVDYDKEEMTVSPSSGRSGTNTVTVTLKKYNNTNATYDYHFVVASENERGSAKMDVKVTQEPVFVIENRVFEVKPEGETIHLAVTTDADLSKGFYIMMDPVFVNMYKRDMSSSKAARNQMPTCTIPSDKCVAFPAGSITRSAAAKKWTVDVPVNPNKTSEQLNGYFELSLDEEGLMTSDVVQVTQLPDKIDHSTDTITNDGLFASLLSHKIGKGVPLVIMGDGFLDKDVADGTYHDACQKAADYFFSIEPTKSLRDYFDVYEVTAVSYNNIFSSSTKTAFSCVFQGGSSTRVTGDNDKVLDYAMKAIPEAELKNATVIVVLNDTRSAGTCVISFGTKATDIPTGWSIAYLPMSNGNPAEGDSFECILHHEAVGHGFCKLADEYNNAENGTVTPDALNQLKQVQALGGCRNITTEADVTKTPWATFAADTRYQSEQFGCYEGGYTYAKGVYRATDESIMRYNQNGFDAHQRSLIYTRCMNIALGSAWKYDYEAFVDFDKPSRRTAPRKLSSRNRSQISSHFVPTPPVIVIE